MKPASKFITSIYPDDPKTWEKSWFLTFDVDWACDEVLEDTLEILSSYSAPVTFMITHETRTLEVMRESENISLGIHPNFNSLLDGSHEKGADSREVIRRLMDFVPEARCVRGHSVAQSSRILDVCAEAGLTHDLNTFIPSGSQNDVKPWWSWNGMVRVPYFWEDDVHCLYQNKTQQELEPFQLIKSELKFGVLNFHPIHVFLNTESLNRYETTRPFHNNGRLLRQYRYEGYGTRDRLIELLQAFNC
jgi:hypothetical protein